MKPGPSRLNALFRWNLSDILKNLVGEVLSVRSLGATKVVVGCSSSHQQQRLSRMTTIGGVDITTKIPQPKVEGVVRDIPTDISTDQVLEKIDPDAHPLAVQRLTYSNGEKSSAVRVTFADTTLPETVMINKKHYSVSPYVHSVSRCFKCQRLGHSSKECTATSSRCPTCGTNGHRASECKGERRCINCSGAHSAAYKGCPALKRLTEANKIRAQAYMPKARAVQLAKAKVENNPVSSNDVPPPVVPLGWTHELPVKEKSLKPAHAKPAVDDCAPTSGQTTSVKRPDFGYVSINVASQTNSDTTGKPSSSRTTAEEQLTEENKKLQNQVHSLQQTIEQLQKEVQDLSKRISTPVACTSSLSISDHSVRQLYESLGINDQFLSTLTRIYDFSHKAHNFPQSTST